MVDEPLAVPQPPFGAVAEGANEVDHFSRLDVSFQVVAPERKEQRTDFAHIDIV